MATPGVLVLEAYVFVAGGFSVSLRSVNSSCAAANDYGLMTGVKGMVRSGFWGVVWGCGWAYYGGWPWALLLRSWAFFGLFVGGWFGFLSGRPAHPGLED